MTDTPDTAATRPPIDIERLYIGRVFGSVLESPVRLLEVQARCSITNDPSICVSVPDGYVSLSVDGARELAGLLTRAADVADRVAPLAAAAHAEIIDAVDGVLYPSSGGVS